MIGRGASRQAARIHAARHGGRRTPGLATRACRDGCGQRGLAGCAFGWQTTTTAVSAKHISLGELGLLLQLGSRRCHHGRSIPCRRRCCWGGRSGWHRWPLRLGRHDWRGCGHGGGRRDGVPAVWARSGDSCHVRRHGQGRATVAALKLDRFWDHPMDIL